MIEVLREVYRVTEWRDGAVYKTEFVEYRWVPLDSPEASFGARDGDLRYGAVSTSYEGPTMRMVNG